MTDVEKNVWFKMDSKKDLKDPKNPLHEEYQKQLDIEQKRNDEYIKEQDRLNNGKWWRTS